MTVPVGVADPDGPATVTVTNKDCAVVMLDNDNPKVTVGAGSVTVTDAVPEALLYVDELDESGV